MEVRAWQVYEGTTPNTEHPAYRHYFIYAAVYNRYTDFVSKPGKFLFSFVSIQTVVCNCGFKVMPFLHRRRFKKSIDPFGEDEIGGIFQNTTISGTLKSVK